VSEPSDDEIEQRVHAAGRFGFVLGCIAAVIAFGISLFRAPKPLSPLTVLTAGLMAAMNVPLGIAMGLLGERMTRKKTVD
jgi:hypothetical protein